MEFDSDWMTLGRHRIRLRSTRGFPTEGMRTMAEVVRLAVDSNMSARARIVEIACSQEKSYEITLGTTMSEDKTCAPHLETAIAVVLGLLPQQVHISVISVTQNEVDLHFGVYERMLAEKLGATSPLR
ncbi:hypothetical protein [Burkholderia ubonensis]|uniref:hypothetical protein n=1 Tax=Burkholderia ubonensis TaxID=101571 RepID=UPI00016A3688|nr:hypothetical protein [Burkholderia ubonensis]